ncbi:hypothetical protein BH20ACI4_BH20ACI4_24840 [soil metagenome]
MKKVSLEKLADKLAEDILISGKSKRIKVRTLLGQFNFEKRTEENATKITELLSKRNILLNPSIMKFGDTWQLKLDDRVYLSERKEFVHEENEKSEILEIYDYQEDRWLDDIQKKQFRTEKEVENKFILPLLERLGFKEDDRYDGMIVSAAHGSKATTLEVDFALFNSENEDLEGQTLLVVEAKKEGRLYKQVELDKAQKQVKSYAIWLSCHFGLVTDSKTIQVIDLFPSIKGMQVVFDCKRENLKENFRHLYKLISKDSLTKYYEKLIR